LSESERAALRQGLRTPDAFRLRRCQILLASDHAQVPSRIAAALGCSSQSVRKALRAFAADGLACLDPKPKTPKTIHLRWPRERDEDLRALLHQSPRNCGSSLQSTTIGPRRSSSHVARSDHTRKSDSCVTSTTRRPSTSSSGPTA